MINDIQLLLDNYIRWLKDKTALNQIDKHCVEVTTPHLDRHNDCLQFYVRQENGGYLLTDDGYIINDLISSGCPLDSKKRQKLLKTTLNGFGVQREGEQLILKATSENFSQQKHNLVQAMLAVNNLFYLASPNISSLASLNISNVFYKDVTQWLDAANIRFTEKVKFTGKSGYNHEFDFSIPKSHQYPERIIQTINSPKKDNTEGLVFKWLDTCETRTPDTELYAFLNDAAGPISESVISAFQNYDLKHVLWSDHENVTEELAA